MTKNYGSKKIKMHNAWPPWYFGITHSHSNGYQGPPVKNVKIHVEKPGWYLGITQQHASALPIESADEFLKRMSKIKI